VLALSVVLIPLMGLAYRFAAPHELDPMTHRLMFSAFGVLLLATSWLPGRPVRLAWMTRLSMWLFTAWFVLLSAVNGFSLVRVMGVMTLQFAAALVMRRTIEGVVFNTMVLATAVTVLTARGAPASELTLSLCSLGAMAAMNIASMVLRDVTLHELGAREQALRRARDELELRVIERTDELHCTVEALEQQVQVRAVAEARARTASVAKSTFLANMSHELRTPLNAIIGYAELVLEELEDEPDAGWSEEVERIHRAGNHLLTMINDVLDLAKVEAGRLEVHIDEVDLRELLDLAGAAVHPLCVSQGTELAMRVDGAVDDLRTDEVRLRQIVVNLLSNAAKFTESGRIDLRAWADDRHLWVEVSDTGCGIAAEHLPTLFDKFTQADPSSTRRHGGTGLGLAISRELARLLDGDLTARSTLGQGSTFTLRVARRHSFLQASLPPTVGILDVA
jgi:signal transduction histidine kinase